ncbi:bifunctional metallophosphatase/5'-nucleotidase [Actinoalloteichus spitiensis]|uniref:bifunctional metallophosphatase/5'-nucleotidase n=1 Tax=Actinoalloteichus spitiensis TaxID=252394 RepID=UPI00037A1A4B|nr:5'-nucleotidase C-terminal domain-containing protein [Actinoalloteichus spitiensis]
MHSRPTTGSGRLPGRGRTATRLGVALAGVAVALPALAGPAAGADARGRGVPEFTLTVMGTSDLHGNVFNWDYFADAEYADSSGNHVGLAKVSTLVNQVRADRGAHRTMLVDAGDTIQGTPLAYYHAVVDPVTESGETHPMAAAMNAVGYDASAVGNHEFNYGLDLLDTFEEQADFPLLGANVLDVETGEPAYRPYTIETVRPDRGRAIRVGFLGLTTPGSAIWDRAHVEGRLEFDGIVERARTYVPEMRAAGADVVIALSHSGIDPSSSYGDALPFPENASGMLAEQVPGIDAILAGHSHQEVPERFVTNEETGQEVLITQPKQWGQRLSVMDIDLRMERGRWTVTGLSSHVLDSATVPEDRAIVDLVADQHEAARAYVNGTVGHNARAMSAATSRYEDTAAVDFINQVQAETVAEALADTEHADLPVLAAAAPFNRDAVIPEGEVTVRDVASLYGYDNTLLGIVLTGAQLRDFLEKSAEYYQQVDGPGPHAANDVTNAPTATAPNGTPDYLYDIVGGLDAALTYDLDLGQPVGQRVVDLAYDGVAVADDQEFVLALNNYRQSGGGNFPHVTEAPVVYDELAEIRQLLIDWVAEREVVDSDEFHSVDWRLVFGGEELLIEN